MSTRDPSQARQRQAERIETLRTQLTEAEQKLAEMDREALTRAVRQSGLTIAEAIQRITDPLPEPAKPNPVPAVTNTATTTSKSEVFTYETP